MNIKNFICLTAILVSFTLNIQSQTLKQEPLLYEFDALEPYIDAKTMEIHYSKHHATYTKNLNEALQSLPHIEKDITKIIKNISKYSIFIRNNAGGYYNHNLFWQMLSPNGGGKPKGKLLEAIEKDFGSFETFCNDFEQVATSVFGSGWVWLIYDGKKLLITSTSNQDNPLMDIAKIKGQPVLCLDVWEHAYYLKYQNNRIEYIKAFWNIVNWQTSEKLYRQYHE
ncbi:MAG: superoxide dismutase [Bacteroidales bacterium]|jgi:Fe-Mn family superoxide dismutase|nr:superoxide dismutase [Bacteroidales bacterium]